jgi:hypothetical protein
MSASEAGSCALAGDDGRDAGAGGAPVDAAPGGESGRSEVVGWQAGAPAPTNIARTSSQARRRIGLTSSTRPEAARAVKGRSRAGLCHGLYAVSRTMANQDRMPTVAGVQEGKGDPSRRCRRSRKAAGRDDARRE